MTFKTDSGQDCKQVSNKEKKASVECTLRLFLNNVCARVYNCSLAVLPSAPGRILGECGSVLNYLGIPLLFRKQLHFVGLAPIQDCRQVRSFIRSFVRSFIHSTHRYSVPGCGLGKSTVDCKTIRSLPVKSSHLQREAGNCM